MAYIIAVIVGVRWRRRWTFFSFVCHQLPLACVISCPWPTCFCSCRIYDALTAQIQNLQNPLYLLLQYAQDMFDGLFQTADTLANQVTAASARCSRLLQVRECNALASCAASNFAVVCWCRKKYDIDILGCFANLPQMESRARIGALRMISDGIIRVFFRMMSSEHVRCYIIPDDKQQYLQLPIIIYVTQALPEAEQRTTDAIGSGTGIDDNAAVEAIKAERQHANQVMTAPASVYLCVSFVQVGVLFEEATSRRYRYSLRAAPWCTALQQSTVAIVIPSINLPFLLLEECVTFCLMEYHRFHVPLQQ